MYIHISEYVLENETHKILWGFKICTDLLILVRRLDLVLINNKKISCYQMDFSVPAVNRGKIIKSEKMNKYLHLVRELKNLLKIKESKNIDKYLHLPRELKKSCLKRKASKKYKQIVRPCQRTLKSYGTQG